MARWYSYDGVSDPTLPGSYYSMTTKPNCASGGSIICAIYLAENTSGTPGSLTDVLDYISNAQATLVSQPNGGSKRFVYVKNLG